MASGVNEPDPRGPCRASGPPQIIINHGRHAIVASDLSTQIHGELHTSQLGTFSGGICGRILQTKKRLPLSTVQSELTNGGVRRKRAGSTRPMPSLRASADHHKPRTPRHRGERPQHTDSRRATHITARHILGGICGRTLQTKERLPLSTVQSELTNGGVRPH